MIAVDTNVLLYAHRQDSPFHSQAKAWLTRLAEGRAQWAIPWTCLHEFLSIASNPRVYQPPGSMDAAIAQVDSWLESPTLTVLRETHDHWAVLTELLRAADVRGAGVHDARIAALCITHGVTEILTLDRDFSRYPQLAMRSLDS